MGTCHRLSNSCSQLRHCMHRPSHPRAAGQSKPQGQTQREWDKDISPSHSSGRTAQSPADRQQVHSITRRKGRIGTGGLVFFGCAILTPSSSQASCSLVVQRYPIFNYSLAFVHAFLPVSNALLIPFFLSECRTSLRSSSDFDLLCEVLLDHLSPQ